MIWTRILDFLLRRRHEEAAPPPRPVRDLPVIRRAADLPEQPQGPRIPRFQGSASETGRSAGGNRQLDQARQKLQRAFTPSQPVQDARRFAGRKETLLSLIRAVEEQHLHAVIFGDRGMGKTSMLHVFSRLAREARYIVRYTSCSEISEFDPVFRAIAADVPLLYHVDFDPTSDAAEQGASLASVLPEDPVTPALISELFGKLSGTRILIVLDEFDRAHSAEFKRSIAELIKNLSDQAVPAQIVIAGVAANLTELLEHIPSIRRNVVGIPVTVMDDEEVLELLRLGEAVSGMRFEDRALEGIVDAAQGSPYISGLLAQYAASHALDGGRQEVGTDDVSHALKRVLGEVKVRLAPRSQYNLDALLAGTPIAQVATLAREGLRNFGMLRPDLLAGEHAAAGAAATTAGVLVPNTDAEHAGMRFADDSVAQYLWLASRMGEGASGGKADLIRDRLARFSSEAAEQ